MVEQSVITNTRHIWKDAQGLIPGGVNSPVRAWRAVGREPLFFERGQGATVWDTEGRAYIDYVMGWGPLILGHAHASVQACQKKVTEGGTALGMPTRDEVRLAKLVQTFFPSLERLRLTNSGTEAAMTALRLARAVTGREEIIKFDGCYHGHVDALLVQAGSGGATLGEPDSAGVTAAVRYTRSLPYNDVESFRSVMRAKGKEIAAVIVEPIAGNMGVVPADIEFLRVLRQETQKCGALLIFDEVMTGFRVAHGGAQSIYQITPDLTLLGKVLGGGLPIGAVGGSAKILDELSPVGTVYQAGTFSGNRLSVNAGLATLEILKKQGFYARIEEQAARLVEGIEQGAKQAGVEVVVNRLGSMLTPFFSSRPVTDFATAQATDAKRFSRFFTGLLDRGALIPPSRFETWFVSSAHTVSEIDETIGHVQRTLSTPGF